MSQLVSLVRVFYCHANKTFKSISTTRSQDGYGVIICLQAIALLVHFKIKLCNDYLM